MRARKAAVEKAVELFENHEGSCSHIGIVMIRQLLDFIYEGRPTSEEEAIGRKKVEEFMRNPTNKGVNGAVSSASE